MSKTTFLVAIVALALAIGAQQRTGRVEDRVQWLELWQRTAATERAAQRERDVRRIQDLEGIAWTGTGWRR